MSRFAAYAASKAALNQALRHMAAELKRADDDTIVLALHPGEVATYEASRIIFKRRILLTIAVTCKTYPLVGKSRA